MPVLYDLIFLCLIGLSIFWIYIQSGSSYLVFGLTFLAILVSGTLCESFEIYVQELNRTQLNCSFVLCISLSALISPKGRKQIEDKKIKVFVLIASSTSILSVLLARLFAENQTDGIFVQLSYLLGAEDNAAWLQPAAQLTAKGSVNLSQAGGPLVIYLSISQSLGRVLTTIFGSSNSIISQTINSVVIAYILLFVLSAIAITPALGLLPKMNEKIFLTISFAVWFIYAGGLFQAVSSGHLSLCIACIFFTFGISLIVQSEKNNIFAALIGSLVLVVSSTTWLPLMHSVLISVPFSAILISKYFNYGQNISKKIKLLMISICSILSTLLIYIEKLSYSMSSTSRIKSLMTADGGTSAANQSVVIAILIAFVFLEQERMKESDLKVEANRFYKIFFSIFIYVAVIFVSNIIIGGSINYGSTKLLFGVSVILLPLIVLIVAKRLVINKNQQNQSRLALSLFLSIVVFGVSQGPMNQLLFYVSPAQWRTSNTTNQWPDELLKVMKDKTINEPPIGCISVDDSGDYSVNEITYVCTRFMLSITGNWDNSNYLNEFQLFNDQSTISNLKKLDPEIRSKNLWLLYSVNKEVLGEIQINQIIKYYEKFEKN